MLYLHIFFKGDASLPSSRIYAMNEQNAVIIYNLTKLGRHARIGYDELP